MHSSYIVILFAPTPIKEVFWVYDSCTLAWKVVILWDNGVPFDGMNQITSRSVLAVVVSFQGKGKGNTRA